ncbi:hypothetical protein Xenpb_02355 [Xenorhabdus sp. PB62.4]|nr:hypothetical protein [Xenorhabdus sp. PB62.4]
MILMVLSGVRVTLVIQAYGNLYAGKGVISGSKGS